MKKRSLTLALMLVAVSAGCQGTGSTTAEAVCTKLVTAGVAANCRKSVPEGLLVQAALERYEFDLPSAPGKTGQILRFEKEEHYDFSVEGFSKMAMLVGRHRYGSARTLIFVQLDTRAPDEDGVKTKAIVDAL